MESAVWSLEDIQLSKGKQYSLKNRMVFRQGIQIPVQIQYWRNYPYFSCWCKDLRLYADFHTFAGKRNRNGWLGMDYRMLA
jgi:hypothetical protein